MTRVAYAAPLAILAILFAGCTSRGPDTPSNASIRPMEHPYSAGTGVVQAVTPAPGPIAAGPAASSPESGLQRLRIRMDDGRVVYVDTPGGDFAPGTRVQLSDANEIRRR